MVVITLAWSEMLVAANVGVMRSVQNMKIGTQQRFGTKRAEYGWQNEIVGCLAEIGLAKHLGRFWTGAIGNYKAADVGNLHQVRSTEWNEGRLILHNEDHDHMPYVLARVVEREVTLVGWLYAKEGKRQEWWHAPQKHPQRLAFFVPNDCLHEMATLPTEQELAAA